MIFPFFNTEKRFTYSLYGAYNHQAVTALSLEGKNNMSLFVFKVTKL